MNFELFLPFLVICFLSGLTFVMVQKNIAHVTESHLRILGGENEALIRTRTLVVVKILYLLSIIIITIAALFFLIQY